MAESLKWFVDKDLNSRQPLKKLHSKKGLVRLQSTRQALTMSTLAVSSLTRKRSDRNVGRKTVGINFEQKKMTLLGPRMKIGRSKF